jgi:hypothetical protein
MLNKDEKTKSKIVSSVDKEDVWRLLRKS